jgi:hypothetical protein
MPKLAFKTETEKTESDATIQPVIVLTVSQFEKLDEQERNAFRDAGGTVTNDNQINN